MAVFYEQIIETPSYNDLISRLNSLFTDSYTREKRMTKMLKLANKKLSLRELILSLSENGFLNGTPDNILAAFVDEELLLTHWRLTHDIEIKSYDPDKAYKMLMTYLDNDDVIASFDSETWLSSKGPLILDDIEKVWPVLDNKELGYGSMANLLASISPFADKFLLRMILVLRSKSDIWTRWRICNYLSIYGYRLELNKYSEGLDLAISFYNELLSQGYNKNHDYIKTVLNLIKCYRSKAKLYAPSLFQSLVSINDKEFKPEYRVTCSGLVWHVCVTLRYIYETDINDLPDNKVLSIKHEGEGYRLVLKKNHSYNDYQKYGIEFYNGSGVWYINEEI